MKLQLTPPPTSHGCHIRHQNSRHTSTPNSITTGQYLQNRLKRPNTLPPPTTPKFPPPSPIQPSSFQIGCTHPLQSSPTMPPKAHPPANAPTQKPNMPTPSLALSSLVLTSTSNLSGPHIHVRQSHVSFTPPPTTIPHLRKVSSFPHLR